MTSSSADAAGARTTGPGPWRPGRRRRLLVLGLPSLIVVLVLVAAGWFTLSYLPDTRDEAVSTTWRELRLRLDSRRDAIEFWVREGVADAQVVADFPSTRTAFASPAGAASVRQHMGTLLRDIARTEGMRSVRLVDTLGHVLAGSTDRPLDSALLETVRVAATREGPVTEFVRGADGIARVAVIRPVRLRPDASPAGVVLVVRDPEEWLYPLLRVPPLIQPSSVTFLVRRDGDSATVLSPARRTRSEPMSLRAPLTPGLPSTAAAMLIQGFVETSDYFGIPVLAATTPIAGTRWGLAIKVDRADALAEWRERMWASGTTLAGLLLLLGMVISVFWWGQRKSFEASAAGAQAHMGALLDQANDPILFVELDGTIRSANHRAEEFYGVPPGGLNGRVVFALRPPELQPDAAEWHEHMLRREDSVFRTVHVAAGGRAVPVEVSSRRVRVADDEVFVSVVRDIGERQRAEDRILRLNRMLRTLSEINSLMLRGQSAEQILQEACDIAVDHGGFQLAWVGRPEPDGTVSVAAAAGKAGYLDGIVVRWDEGPEGLGPAGRALRDRQTTIVADLQRDASFAPWARRATVHGLRAVGGAPIRKGTEVVAALLLYSDVPGAFDAESSALLEELAGDIGFALRAIDERTALRETEAKLAAFFHSPAMGMLFGTIHGGILDANDAFLQLVGYSREDLRTGRFRWDEITPPEFLPLDAQRIDEARERGVCTPYEKQYIRKDGTTVWVLVGYALLGKHRDLSVAYILDISDRKAMETALHETEQRFRLLVEGAPVGIIIHAGGVIRYLNGTAARLFGTRAPTALVGTALLDRVHPDHRGTVLARIAAMRDQDRPAPPLEERLVRVDGSAFVAEVEAVPVVHEAEAGVMVFFRDVTAHRAAVEEQALVSTALEQSAELAIITDAAGTILYVNPAFERTTGYSRAEAVGKNPRILKSGQQDADFYRRMWATLTSGDVFTATVTNRKKDGDTYVAEVAISPVRDAAGRITRYLGLQRDITREHQLEEQLRQSQKMEAVGRLTGGIAHDFNNLLGVILANAAILRRDLPAERGDLRDYVDDMMEAATNGGAMVRKLLAFSRRERLAPATVDLVQELEDTARTLRRFLPETIAVQVRHAQELLPAIVDPAALEQIMLNLATNARDAMPEGGTLTVSGREIEMGEGEAGVATGGQPGRFVVVEVADTGHGMDEETLSHVFEPFFTTKPTGHGTGLGLAMVFGLMRQLGGFVRITSAPGRGTTVRLFFRAGHADRISGPARAVAEPLAPRPGGLILVVEDQEQLRRATSRALSRLGYEVLVAGSGEEALVVIQQSSRPLSLVLSDLVMPGMSGVELHARLRERGADVPFLLMSGYASGTGEAHAVPDGMELIMKPWTLEALGQRIRQLLTRHIDT